ncbi:MAG: hypothetical protein IPL99_08995 [Candidatus Competibacteraceae bacterium]|nr:hypothetical protein [Candidatus Competibacteraceae bacterium]
MSGQSPQIDSYQQFRQELAGLIQQGLQQILIRLLKKRRIRFEPEIKVTGLGDGRLANADESAVARSVGGSLVEPIQLLMTLHRKQGLWTWRVGDLPWMTETGALIDNGYERFMLMQLRQQNSEIDDPEIDDPWRLDHFRVYRIGDFLREAVEKWQEWLEKRLLKSFSEGALLDFEKCKEELIKANRGRREQTLFTQLMQEVIQKNPLSQRVILEDQSGGWLKRACLSRGITYKGPRGPKTQHDPEEEQDAEKTEKTEKKIKKRDPREPRQFHWSHIGRLCPLDTSQGDDVGLTLALTVSARIDAEGRIGARYREVLHTEAGIRISENDVFLHAGDKAALDGWIAFPDQRKALENGEEVYAHCGSERLKRVKAGDVRYIHAEESDLFGLAANLLPYRQHNNPLRGTMACHFLRQALPLSEKVLPRIRTPFEIGQDIAYGRELRVGYLPWYGYNFEDALVISESAAEALTSVHTWRVRFQLLRSEADHNVSYAIRRNDISAIPNIDSAKYDERGFICVGKCIAANEPLALEPPLSQMPNQDPAHRFSLHHDPKRRAGQVTGVQVIPATDPTRPATVEFALQETARTELGDKLANRHGHKGVIGQILPDGQMPYFLLDAGASAESSCRCGETRPHRHLQVLINPLSVISRMNLGQLRETVEARSPELKGLPDKVPCFEPRLDEPPRRLESEVLVGEQYVLKLDHNAAGKVHARSQEPQYYSAFEQQPLRGRRLLEDGRRLEGGQRLGEMEVWALMAHNAPALLQEMLTVKSDNPRARIALSANLRQERESDLSRVELPEALRTFAACLLGLGLQLQATEHDARVEPLVSTHWPPEAIAGLRLEPLDQQDFRTRIAYGEVNTPKTNDEVKPPETGDEAPKKKKSYHFHPDGLESEQIFGPRKNYTCACGKHNREKPQHPDQCCERCHTPLLPAWVRRRRFGYIALAAPTPNPYALRYGDIVLPGGVQARDLLVDLLAPPPKKNKASARIGEEPDSTSEPELKARLKFRDWPAAETFIAEATVASPRLRERIEQAFNCRLRLETPASVSPLPDQAVAALTEVRNRALDAQGALSVGELIEQQQQKYGEKKRHAQEFGKALSEILAEDQIDILVELLQAQPETARWILNTLPVIPPALRRPRREGSLEIPNDLQVLYQAVLRANAQLDKVIKDRDSTDPKAQQSYREKRKALQKAIAQLMLNRCLPWRQRNGRVRNTLSAVLEGKRGLLIGHLLGKRVDFSGRAVIVPDPKLPMDECRLPPTLALSLFRPQLKAALAGGNTDSEHWRRIDCWIDAALAGDDDARKEIQPALERVVNGRLVLLNRQPTLHRLGLLAFRARLGTGSVIALPVLVTTGFNADFDGDQMAVYLPLTQLAIKEAQRLLPSRHLWHPAQGGYELSLAQDLALGGYLEDGKTKKERTADFERGVADPDLLERIERFREQAFDRATASGLSFSIADVQELAVACSSSGDADQFKTVVNGRDDSDPFKRMVLSGARGDWDKLVELAGRYYAGWPQNWPQSNLAQGLNDGELLDRAVPARHNLVETKLGTAEGGALTKKLVARAQQVWITQEDCGTDQGLPVSIVEQVWSQEAKQIESRSLWGKKARDILIQRLYGRTLAQDYDAEFSRDTDLDAGKAEILAKRLIRSPGTRVTVRSPATCKAPSGVCRKCYGLPWTAGRQQQGWGAAERAPLNSRVGIIAAQAVGEPGTQLALHSKHKYGEAEAKDAEQLATINKVKDFVRDFPKNRETVSDADAATIWRDTLADLYREEMIDIAPVHFETLWRKGNAKGWLTQAAEKSEYHDGIHKVLVSAAAAGQQDDLAGLKECALLGAPLPYH